VVRVDALVLRVERDELRPHGAGVRGHDGKEALVRRDREHRADGLDELALRQVGECLGDGGDQVLVAEAADGGFVEDGDRGGLGRRSWGGRAQCARVGVGLGC
jgi:hypothetical protein